MNAQLITEDVSTFVATPSDHITALANKDLCFTKTIMIAKKVVVK